MAAIRLIFLGKKGDTAGGISAAETVVFYPLLRYDKIERIGKSVPFIFTIEKGELKC